VFQRRYKAIVVERDSYLKKLARYVVLNPVRAKRVQHPGEWPWSSCAMTAGKAPSPVWLSTGGCSVNLVRSGKERKTLIYALWRKATGGQASGPISSSRFTWAVTRS
jgi:hypothetical protein